MSASLGGLIKDYRLRKNLDQIDLATKLGWKEPSRLSRIEQGVIKRPTRETINRICKALKLSRKETNTILLSGGYLHTKKEIKEIREEIRSFLNNWDYPVAVYDFTWRLIWMNDIGARMTFENTKDFNTALHKLPNVLELNFDPKFSQNKFGDNETTAGLYNEQINSITQYKYELKVHPAQWGKEKSILKLMKDKNFFKLWTEADDRLDHQLVSDYTFVDYWIPARDRKYRLKFHLFNVQMLNDPRISFEFHTPADIDTFKYFEELNK